MLARLLARLLALVLLLSPIAAVAEPEPLSARVADVRSAILSRDVEGVVRLLSEARKAGKFQVRTLYTVFDTTDPGTIAFVADWRKSGSGASYASAAEAQILYKGGWLMRGRRTVDKTHPRAMEAFQIMHGEAWQLANDAYNSDPGLLPASDILIQLGNTMNEREYAFDVLAEVMERDPNWSSLQSALWLTKANWGGTSGMAERLCELYAPKIEWDGGDIVQYCLLWGLYTYHVAERRQQVYAMLDAMTNEELAKLPEIARLKAGRMIRTDRPDVAGLEFGRWYFDTFDVTDIDLAETYDRYFVAQFGGEPVSKTVLDRAQARARAALKHDPYNPELLDLLSRGEIVEATARSVRVKARPAEETLDFAYRRLMAEPYNGKAWQDFRIEFAAARDTYSPHMPSFLYDEPMWINTIHYSLHDPDIIAAYMTALQTALGHLRKARLEKARDPETWMDPRPDVDAFERLICPLLRAWRVLDLANDHYGREPGYPLDTEQAYTFATLRTEAEQAGRCVHERTADAWELVFEAVDTQLALERY